MLATAARYLEEYVKTSYSTPQRQFSCALQIIRIVWYPFLMKLGQPQSWSVKILPMIIEHGHYHDRHVMSLTIMLLQHSRARK